MDRHPAAPLPPFTPKIPSAFSRYIDPDGPTFLRYQDEQLCESAARRAKIREWIPRDAGQYLEREQWRAEIEAAAEGFDARRQADDLLAWKFRVELPAAFPERAGEFIAIAEKLETCRRSCNIGKKPDGGLVYAWESKCGESRLCEDEAKTNANRIARRNGPEIEAFRDENLAHDAFYLVFSMHNFRPGTLAFSHAHFHKLFNEWRNHAVEYTPVEFLPDGTVKRGRVRKKSTFAHLQGALTVMEDPLSAHDDWNVHLNGVLLFDGFFDWREARAVWHDVCGAEVQLHIELIKPGGIGGALAELIKYAAKVIPAAGELPGAINPRTGQEYPPALVDWPPERFVEWWDARQYRRVRGYGRLYAVDGKTWDRHDPTGTADTDEARRRGKLRLGWLEQAGIEGTDDQARYLLTPWKEIPSEVKPELRAVIARGDDYLDMDLVEWIGEMSWSFAGYTITMHGDQKIPPRPERGVDLITGDKSGAPALDKWHRPPIREGPGLTTGPPAS